MMCKFKHFLLICLIVFQGSVTMSQTLGGGNTYAFLKLPAGPQLTALGSSNVSVFSRDISMSAHNPALLRTEMDRQMLASFNVFQGIRQMNGMFGFHSERLHLSFSGGIDHIHYGEGVQTDAAGNILGNFRANDYAIRLAFSRRYLDRWHYGATIKYVNSTYGIYTSQAIMADVGINYLDSSRMLQVGFVAKNMGLQLTSYAGQGEDLPFDIQLGITKRLLHAPLQFSLTAHRLHQFDILYRDTVFNTDNYGNPGKDGFVDKLFRHLILSMQGFVGERVELTLGYNFLRRAELSMTRSANGMTGFSMGAGVSLKRMQVRYAGSIYQNGVSYHQFGLNLDLSGKK